MFSRLCHERPNLLPMYPTLRDFLTALDRAGELKRISSAVSPVLEIAAIADRTSKMAAPSLPADATKKNDPRFHDRGGQALLFTNVIGSDFPVLINAFGSYRRMEMALGCHDTGHTPGGFDALAAKIGGLVKPEFPGSLGQVLKKAREFLPLLKIPPRRKSGSGLCQEIIKTGDQIDCTRLPLLRCWPLDGDLASVGYDANINDNIPGLSSGTDWNAHFRGRYITLAGIHTIHANDIDNPKPPSHNIGMYRVQLFGKKHLSMHWHMHHDGASHWRSWKKLGQRMPVAIVLGGESVLPYAATSPLPPGISELLLAGFLNRGGIEMVRAKTVPLWVPANAEIVIEGFVNSDAGFIGFDPRTGEPLGPGAVFEGPFGDHTGFYSMPDRYPLLEVTAITHRREAVYPTTIVGLPPQEDYYLGKATERLFLPLLKTLVHDIEDYDLPMFGAFHNAAFIKIKKAYPLQARRVMHSIWGAGQMAWTKNIFVVDSDVDVHDTAAVLSAVALNCHPGRGIETVNGPLDILDHAAPRLGAGMKMGFDATRPIPGEEVAGIPITDLKTATLSPLEAASLESQLARINGVVAAAIPQSCAAGWAFLSIAKAAPGDGIQILEEALAICRGHQLPRFIVAVGDAVDASNFDQVMFHFCANCDASRDTVEQRNAAGHIIRRGFDATSKVPAETRNGQPVRAWPPIIEMDAAIQSKVTRLLD